jgi:hypothetical protein
MGKVSLGVCVKVSWNLFKRPKFQGCSRQPATVTEKIRMTIRFILYMLPQLINAADLRVRLIAVPLVEGERSIPCPHGPRVPVLSREYGGCEASCRMLPAGKQANRSDRLERTYAGSRALCMNRTANSRSNSNKRRRENAAGRLGYARCVEWCATRRDWVKAKKGAVRDLASTEEGQMKRDN